MKEVFENHGRDCRFNPLGEICQTITSILGTGGNNQPLVIETYDARGNGDGKVVNTLTGSHEAGISDYTAIVLGGVQKWKKLLFAD